LSAVAADRADGQERLVELRRLLEDHASAGSALARGILDRDEPASDFWVVEPVAAVVTPTPAVAAREPVTTSSESAGVAAVSAGALRGVGDSSQPAV
jgi:hypothetical protein